jgi:hypothetical protein
MKFIQIDEVTDQLETRPELQDDRYINLVLKMMAWESYVEESVMKQNKNTVTSMKWLKIAQGDAPILKVREYNISPALEVLLAYTILKHDDPDAMWTIHIGKYENSQYDMDLWYLQSSPKEGATEVDYTYVGDIPVDEMTIVSNLSTADLEDAHITLDDMPICVASELIKYEHRYRTNTGDSHVLPGSKGEIMKWFNRNRLTDDSNVEEVSVFVDDLLQQGTDFCTHINSRRLWNHTDTPDLHNIHLSRSILKTKILKGINIIFDKYPPQGCVVPISTTDT